MENIGPHNEIIAIEQMNPYRHGWRRASVLIATLAPVLNVALGAFCACHVVDLDNLSTSIYSHRGDHHADGKSHTPAGQPDDDDLCCKCCGTIAVCTENLINIDYPKESPNVGAPLHDQPKRTAWINAVWF
jgi:hypothetical protein